MTARGRSTSQAPTRAPASTSARAAQGGRRSSLPLALGAVFGQVSPARPLQLPHRLIKPRLPSQSIPLSLLDTHEKPWPACSRDGNLTVNVACPDHCTHHFRNIFREAPGKLLGEQLGESAVPTGKAPSAPRTRCKQNLPCCSAEVSGNGSIWDKTSGGTRRRAPPPCSWLEDSTNSWPAALYLSRVYSS